MPRLTDKEREQRRRKLQEEALESVAARGQFNFRLEGKDIKRLYELAGTRKKPVSALVREWVLERLESEEANKCHAPIWAQELDQRLAHIEVLALVALGANQGPDGDAIRCKLRDHVLQHCRVEGDDELHRLLVAQ
jgi:hypothetical protein